MNNIKIYLLIFFLCLSYHSHSINFEYLSLIENQKFIKSNNYKFIKNNHIGYEDTEYMYSTKGNKNIIYHFSIGRVSTFYITYYFP